MYSHPKHNAFLWERSAPCFYFCLERAPQFCDYLPLTRTGLKYQYYIVQPDKKLIFSSYNAIPSKFEVIFIKPDKLESNPILD